MGIIKKLLMFVILFLQIACDPNNLRDNEILDFSKPRALTSLKNFSVSVYDKKKKKDLDIFEDFKREEDFFEIYMSTVLFNPPFSDLINLDSVKTSRDYQSQYLVTLVSKEYIYIDNFDSLILDSKFEIDNVRYFERDVLLEDSNQQSIYLNYNNPKISSRVFCELFSTGQRFTIQRNDQIFESAIREIRKLEIPFKITIELNLISGEDIIAQVLEPDGTPTPAFANPKNQVRYQFYLTLRGIY